MTVPAPAAGLEQAGESAGLKAWLNRNAG